MNLIQIVDIRTLNLRNMESAMIHRLKNSILWSLYCINKTYYQYYTMVPHRSDGQMQRKTFSTI